MGEAELGIENITILYAPPLGNANNARHVVTHKNKVTVPFIYRYPAVLRSTRHNSLQRYRITHRRIHKTYIPQHSPLIYNAEKTGAEESLGVSPEITVAFDFKGINDVPLPIVSTIERAPRICQVPPRHPLRVAV